MKKIKADFLVLGGDLEGLALALALKKKGIREPVIFLPCHYDLLVPPFIKKIEWWEQIKQEILQWEIPLFVDIEPISYSPEKKQLTCLHPNYGNLEVIGEEILINTGWTTEGLGSLLVTQTTKRDVISYSRFLYGLFQNEWQDMERIGFWGVSPDICLAAYLLLQEGKEILFFEPNPFLYASSEDMVPLYGKVDIYFKAVLNGIYGEKGLEFIKFQAQGEEGLENHRVPLDLLVIDSPRKAKIPPVFINYLRINPNTKGILVDESWKTSTPGIYGFGSSTYPDRRIPFSQDMIEKIAFLFDREKRKPHPLPKLAVVEGSCFFKEILPHYLTSLQGETIFQIFPQNIDKNFFLEIFFQDKLIKRVFIPFISPLKGIVISINWDEIKANLSLNTFSEESSVLRFEVLQ